MDDMTAKKRYCRMVGENHACAKLSNSDVFEIRRIYAIGETTQCQLSNKFGVPQTQISNIILRKSWSHI